MGPQRELITNEGSDAFYDGILRYKNPFTDEEAVKWWFLGYDAAEEQHNLFADNKRLVLENESFKKDLTVWKDRYKDSSSEHVKELDGLKKTIAHYEIQETLLFGQRKDKNESIKKVVSYIESKKTLLFLSREKLISDLKNILK